jgi:serine/threonine protein kinase
MTSKAFLRAHEMANDYIVKQIHPVKNLSFEDVPEENFEDEVPSDDDQNQSDSEDSEEEERPVDELYALKWTRKMDSYIFQFSHEYEIVKPVMNREHRKVYAAIRKSDKLPVVIAIVEDLNKVQSQHNIPREVILMSRVRDHASVANIMGWKRLSKNVFAILMSHYVECHVRTCYWTKYLISKYMYSLLSGLAYLHEQQVFHRDIAVNNVMWDSLKRRAIIIDFDNSCMLRSEYCTREVGRDDYDAPEKTLTFKDIANSQHPEGYTDISDVYSSGVIFWMLLNQADSPPSPRYLRKWVQKALDRKTFIYHIEVDLLLKMLFKDPTHRITASEALLHPFFTSFPADDKYIEVEEKFHFLLNYTEPEQSEESEDSGNETEEESNSQEDSELPKESESEKESQEESHEKSHEKLKEESTDEENTYEVKFPDVTLVFDPQDFINVKNNTTFTQTAKIEEIVDDWQEPVKNPEPNFGNLTQLAELLQEDDDEILAQKLQEFHIGTSQTQIRNSDKIKPMDKLFAQQRRRRLNTNKKVA